MSSAVRFLALSILVAGAAACGGGNAMMNGPSGAGNAMMGNGSGVSLLSLSPAGGSVGVSVGAQITMHFNHPMGPGMETLVMLHQGDINGPQVPTRCGWSGDRTTLTCTPTSPLRSGAHYTIHMGGGMMDQDGQGIDWNDMPMMGGQLVAPGMMQGGMSPSMMGPGWRGTNGSYGMEFGFTTA